VTARPAREVLIDVLRAHGTGYLFGNPGSTELPLVDELARHPDLSYIHALQENTAVGAADGYAQATGRPAVLSLHTFGGLGGAMGNLTNAWTTRTPLIVTAGQQRRSELPREPLLSGPLTALAAPVTKWAHELRGPDELALIFDRAFAEAMNPPTGPVFVSIPIDVLDAPTTQEARPPAQLCPAGPAGRLDDMAALLAEAARPAQAAPGGVAIVAGEAADRAAEPLARLAETLGAPVYGAGFCPRNPFPSTHPAWAGYLTLDRTAVGATLGRYGCVLVVGAQAFLLYDTGSGAVLPGHVRLLHLDSDPARLGRNEPTSLGAAGDITASVRMLTGHLAGRVDRAAAATRLEAHRSARAAHLDDLRAIALARYDRGPIDPLAAAHAVLEALPPGGIVVDEVATATGPLRELHRSDTSGRYFFCRGAALGWAMPAALGVQLANPDAPVLCVVGDGAAAYSIQALWTAAHHRIPVVYVVLNDRQYQILRDGLRHRGGASVASERFVAMDLDDPAPDYVRIAEGFGVEAERVSRAEELAEAVKRRLGERRPALIDAQVQGSR